MEECESLDSEITELQEYQCEASEAISQDDEDEVEELHNSLREVVQDQSVKPKLQCLMVDPSFSMVTVQSEDSGIVWETASSRCSTPWASETSSISEGNSMEGSGTAGKITIVFDEEKIVRRRTRSGGRSSRLGDRLSRPGSSRSASALGVERLEMTEVSLPNVKQEKTPTEPDLEEIKNKDQQLFSLISEGYEILNIRVPSKLPTVDEEESTELQDNLSYLDQTPKIRSRNHTDWTQQRNQVLPEEGEIPVQIELSEQDSPEPSADTELRPPATQTDSAGDIDYFEKFTLVDVVVPEEQAPELQEEAEQPAAKPHVEEQKPAKETAADSLSASEDSFVFVTDVEIVGEHLDEVFYGEGPPPDALQRREDDEAESGAARRTRRESQRSGKESGAVLFGSEETILTPIFISPGPPKIIDPILLEEPTAMSFMYSDLYEDAVGERRKSDEEHSEAESVASEKSYKRRLSDSDEADGYLEKFILKDETPTVQAQPESEEDRREGRMMWSQSRFEMTGCLTRVVKEDAEDKTKKEEAKTQEVSVEDKSEDLKSTIIDEKSEIITETKQEISATTEEKSELVTDQEMSETITGKSELVTKTEQEISGTTEEKSEIVTETDHESKETKLSVVPKEQSVRETTVELVQDAELREDQLEGQEVKHEVKRDETDPPEGSTAEPLPQTQQLDSKEEKTEHRREAETASITEIEQPCQTQEVVEKSAEVVVKAAEETDVIASVSNEVPQVIVKSEIAIETTEKSLSEEKATDAAVVAADETAVTETLAEAPAEVKQGETEGQDILTSTEKEISGEKSLGKEKEAAEVVSEGVPPVEVITDCDAAVHAVVEVTEKAVDEKEIKTQVQIDLQEVTSVETTGKEEEHEALAEDTVVETQPPEFVTEADRKSEVKTEISSEVNESVVSEEVKADKDRKQPEILGFKKHRQEESVIDNESAETELKPETKDKMPTEDTKTDVQEMLSGDDELILFVPKGQAVEMDIEISQWPEKIKSDRVPLSEPESTCEHFIEPETSSTCQETLQELNEETMKESLQEVKPEVAEPETSSTCQETLQELNEETMKESVQEVKPEVAEPETSSTCQETLQEPNEETMKESLQEVKPEIAEPETTSTHLETLQEPNEETMKESLQEVKPDVSESETTLTCPLILQELLMPYEETIAEPLPDIKPEVAEAETTSSCPEAPQKTYKEKISEPLLKVKPDVSEPETTLTCPETLLEPYEEKIAEPRLEVKPEVGEAETTSTCPETQQELNEEAISEPLLEIKPEVSLKEEAPPRIKPDNSYSPSIPVEEATEGQKVESDFEEDKDVFSTLRSFTPQEDLSEIHREDIQTDAYLEQEAELQKEEEASETIIVQEDLSAETDLHREDAGQRMEQHEAATEAPEVTVEELEYEVISKQDAKDMPEPQTQVDAEVPKPEFEEDRKGMTEMEMEMKMQEENKVFDLSPEEELIEADYEIIDAEEENQARLAAELQGMDWYCLTCGCLLLKEDCSSQEHHNHEVTAVDKAYEEIKEKLGDWISELQGRSENIEDLVSELELAYNSVEDQCVETEAAMQVQNEEMMALVMEQYNNMSISMEEEKKAKLEQLYDQIVSFQESIDSAKATLETTAREAETDARSPEDIHASLKTALDSAMSLELGPKGLLVFEDYAKGNTSSSNLAQRKGIPVPQRPKLQPQESGSATSTSVTVYWKVNPGDIIDCFQVYCMEDPQGAVSEEYRVTVKESYCVLEELEPDKTYKVWVMAVNYTGCSLPSDRLIFRTAPSVPVIDTERCTVVWDSATLRWSSAKKTPEQSYTLEYCRQYELEGEGLRSISGIKSCEHKVLLQPNENYLFYIKAVNEAGASEQSEAALISTKGTRFHLLKASAHPALELSVDQTTLHYSQDALENTLSLNQQCPSILGELLLAQGRYYWETIVSRSTAYRLGVAYSTASRSSPLGENSLSWCLQCIPTPSGCRYQLLHSDIKASVFVIEMAERVGTLLDYQLGLLSFYNAQNGRLLGTFHQRFTQPCHPALALEMPGSLEVSMVQEVPEFTKDS